jgi:hypothetical protein
MNGLDYWRLCDELSIKEAALLLCDKDPTDFEDVENWKPEERPMGYDAARNAIIRALIRKEIEGTHVPRYETDINGNVLCEFEGSCNIEASLVTFDSVGAFLMRRGFRSGFFTSAAPTSADYLDTDHMRYAPKLAAAVRAWQAVTDVDGMTPKKALCKWLREHAAEYGLSDDEGKPNETGIEEIAKVANWQPGGGAPRTPSA